MLTECPHTRVTTYSRMIWMGSLYEPPEYAWKTICDECGAALEEVPDGSEERQAEWEDDYEE